MNLNDVIIIDRDRQASSDLEAILRDAGLTCHSVLSLEEGVATFERTKAAIVFADPKPQPTVRPLVIALRRTAAKHTLYPYIIGANAENDRNIALKFGTNDLFKKPLDKADIMAQIDNAKRMIRFEAEMARFEHDASVPCAHGFMGRISTAQILLSCIDRADRYGEESYVMSLVIDNADTLINQMGDANYQIAIEALKENLFRRRRRSDLIGQIHPDRLNIIMQRTVNDREPVDATLRMKQVVERFIKDVFPHNIVKMTFQTMSIPSGRLIADETLES